MKDTLVRFVKRFLNVVKASVALVGSLLFLLLVANLLYGMLGLFY